MHTEGEWQCYICVSEYSLWTPDKPHSTVNQLRFTATPLIQLIWCSSNAVHSGSTTLIQNQSFTLIQIGQWKSTVSQSLYALCTFHSADRTSSCMFDEWTVTRDKFCKIALAPWSVYLTGSCSECMKVYREYGEMDLYNRRQLSGIYVVSLCNDKVH